MGSIESVTDGAVPWIGPERRLVAAAVDDGVPVLGVCFGGQLLAEVLGGTVPRRAPARARVAGSRPPIRPGTGRPWLDWHEDALPAPRGRAVARTDVFQAFVEGLHTGLRSIPR